MYGRVRTSSEGSGQFGRRGRTMPAMSVDSAVSVDGHRTAESASLDETYGAYRSQEGVAWIGLYRPTAEEFELHPLAVEDALDAHHRPKLERYGGTFFVVPKPARQLAPADTTRAGRIPSS